MQDYVPYNFSKNKYSHRKMRLFLYATILIIIVTTLSITISLFIKPKTDKYLKEFSYYYVYVDKNQKQTVLTAQRETIRSLGGAGKIFFNENNYYLLAGMYLSKEDAEEIKTNIIKNFPSTGVIKITKTFTKNQKRKISAEANLVMCFKTLNEMITDIQISSMQYLAGSVSESALCSKILSYRHKFESMISDFRDVDEFSTKILAFEELIHLHITNFCNDFFVTTNKQAVLSELLINLTLSKCDLVDNL